MMFGENVSGALEPRQDRRLPTRSCRSGLGQNSHPKEPLAVAGFQAPQIPPVGPTCAIWIRLTTLSSERRSARRSGRKGIVDSWRLEQYRGFDIGRKLNSRNFFAASRAPDGRDTSRGRVEGLRAA